MRFKVTTCQLVLACLLLLYTGRHNPLSEVRCSLHVEAQDYGADEYRRAQRERRRRERQREQRKRERDERERARQRFDDDYGFSWEDDDNPNTMDAGEAFSTLFSTAPPRDVIEGAWRAIKNVLSGASIGVAALIVSPILGAFQSGMVGFIVGGVIGSIAAVISTVSGILSGLRQIWLGAGRTPTAIRSAREGMLWDTDKQEWVFYYLEAEAAELSSESAYKAAREKNEKRRAREGDGGRSVKDLSYYELLDLSPDATSGQIKRAYYRKARDVHPDKNKDDPNAAEKFRKINAAYQTLSDENKRAAYDTWGAASVDENALNKQFDPYVFFAIMFGSHLVEPYIGELTVASVTDSIIKLSGSNITFATVADVWSSSSYKPRKRQVDIALNIRDRVRTYVNGTVNKQEFREGCRLEAEAIAEGAFGSTFLATIGSTLRLEADTFLGSQKSLLGLKGGLFWVRKKINGARKKMATVGAVYKTARATWRAYSESLAELEEDEVGDGSTKGKSKTQRKSKAAGDEDANRNADPQVFLKNMENSLPTILELAWAYNVHDITSTLTAACRKLFYDTGALSREERIRRAEGVRILGNEFVSVGRSSGGGGEAAPESGDIKARAEVAFRASLAKAQGQDVPDNSEEMIKEAKRKAASSKS